MAESGFKINHWTPNQTFHFSPISPVCSLVGPKFIFQKQTQSRKISVTLLDALGEGMVALEPPNRSDSWQRCAVENLPNAPFSSSLGALFTAFQTLIYIIKTLLLIYRTH